MAELIWREPFRVRAYEVGPGDYASPLAVVDYLQEAAGEHARALGVEQFEIGEEGAAWVLARLGIQFLHFPAWREAVWVETWPSGRDGLRATRDLLLLNEAGALLARARTVWFVVDLARRRPVRLPPSVLAIDPPDREPALLLDGAPQPPEAPQQSRAFTIRRSDLDRNAHANNARFVEWALETVDREQTRLSSLDIAFRGEAFAEDTVLSEVAETGEGAFAHAILRQADRRPLAIARTTWK